jgi:hypothetical protein
MELFSFHAAFEMKLSVLMPLGSKAFLIILLKKKLFLSFLHESEAKMGAVARALIITIFTNNNHRHLV